MIENQHAHAKKSNSRIIVMVSVCVALVLVAAFVGVYYLAPLGNEQKPSANVVTNFSDGAWANYAVETYNKTGAVKGHGTQNVTVTAGTYNEKPCWIYFVNIIFTYNNGTLIQDMLTHYEDKSTYSNMQLSQQRYINGKLIFNETGGPEAADYHDELSEYRNMTIIASDQALSVPAGTFSTTVRESQDESNPTTTIWLNKEVPAFGEVKIQFSSDGYPICVYTLESYGY